MGTDVGLAEGRAQLTDEEERSGHHNDILRGDRIEQIGVRISRVRHHMHIGAEWDEPLGELQGVQRSGVAAARTGHAKGEFLD